MPRWATSLRLPIPYVSERDEHIEQALGYELRSALLPLGFEVTRVFTRPAWLNEERHVNVFDLRLRPTEGRNSRHYRLMPPIRPVSDLRLFPNAEKHGADKNWIMFFMDEVSEQYGVLFQGFDLFPVTLDELRQHAPEQLVAWDAFLERGGVAHPEFYRGTNPLAPTED